MKFNAFIKQIIPSILITISSLIIFAILFALYSLDWTIYLGGAGLVLLILAFSIAIQFVTYKQQVSLKEELQETQNTLKEVKFANIQKERALEDYFMLWVHQIKTPITASKLLLESAQTTPLNQQLKQELISIDNYTNLALNYLKVSHTDSNLNYDKVTLDQIIAPLLRKYRTQFIQSNIKLHYEKIEAEVLTDPNLAQVMIEQIISNALKYNKQGDLWISYSKDVLAIEDNGQGISEENLPRVFERGYSGMNGQLNEKSSGIGLYMVRLISKRLNHPVSIKSELGEGTTLTIEFNTFEETL
ncbi:sensor histidine kinase [Aerococcaceae bacterium DSM 111176]|nr:sensor histidine kinase [Aerococcaceae bacterium DSM 111176]